MPDKEGLEMIRELRRRDRGVRIIAMSGGGRVTSRRLNVRAAPSVTGNTVSRIASHSLK